MPMLSLGPLFRSVHSVSLCLSWPEMRMLLLSSDPQTAGGVQLQVHEDASAEILVSSAGS